MQIKFKSICITSIHTEAALTAIRFQPIYLHRWFEAGLQQ